MLIAGVDEVGRGPLAGPVVTAAVILPDEFDLPLLTDSKKLTEKRRVVLDQAIKEQAVGWALAEASIEEIDELNILHATMLAMQRKVARDNLMKGFSETYPGYGFERNSGYPTKQHREALISQGVTPIHRTSFAPVKKILESL